MVAGSGIPEPYVIELPMQAIFICCEKILPGKRRISNIYIEKMRFMLKELNREGNEILPFAILVRIFRIPDLWIKIPCI